MTDFVTLIPFFGQADKNTPAIPVKPKSNTPSYAEISLKKEPKSMEKISGDVQTNLLSIKELTAKKVEDAIEGGANHANRPKTPFSSDQLKMFWKKFAFKMKEDGNDTIYLAMVKRDPKIIGEFHINHEVDNQVQIDYIQTHISELIEHLRESLKNWAISVDFTISENLEENVKHQTGKDRFNALARKNPNLFTLQKTFNLDVEY